MPDLISEILDAQPRLPPALMFIETPVNADGAVVRDEAGRERYKVIHPHYQDAGAWVKARPELKAADVGDACAVKCSTGMGKYGFGDGQWYVGIKSRKDDRQYNATPYALTRWKGKPTIVAVEGGITEYAVAKPLISDIAKIEAKWTGLFQQAEISVTIDAGGKLVAKHLIRKEYRNGSDYYGTIWETEGNSVDFVTQIQGVDTKFFAWENHGRYFFVEYFTPVLFLAGDQSVPNATYADVEHEYSTISGNLGAHTTLTTGTYELTVQCQMGAYNLIHDCSGGNIYIKGVGAIGFYCTAAGNITVINSDATHKVICTSANDDTRGEAIAGSSHAPAVGDVTRAWYRNASTSATAYTLNWCEFYYNGSNTNVVDLSMSTDNTGLVVSWTNLKFQYNTINPVSYAGSILGTYRYSPVIKSAVVSNISIDSTNYLNDNSLHFGIRVVATSDNVLTMNNIYLNLPSAAYAGGIEGIQTFTITNYSNSPTISNCYVSGKFSSATANRGAAILVGAGHTGRTMTATISNCIAENTNTGDDHGITAYHSNGTVVVVCNNCIAVNCDGASAYGFYEAGTVTSTLNNCGDYNCSTRTNFATDNNPISNKDPSFGNLPAGCVIDTANCPFPDGLAVTNLTDYEMQGSDTFDNLGIDETICTMTGWKYAGTKNITPGIYYILTTFPEVITVLTPNSGTTAGGTAVAVTGLGFGSTQGTGKFYLDGVEQTITAWADDGPDITTTAHAAGAVDASCTNYRGVTFSAVAAYTYTSAGTTGKVVEYAIEIDSGATGVTDTDHACVAGVMRFITGRPGYDGSPAYPTGEAGITVATLEAQWFEGWLRKDGIGTAARMIDVTVSGQYGNLSSFTFSIENSRKWWAWAEANAIWLINKSVRLYVVIDDVFYYWWSGVIREQPRTAVDIQIQCIDSFKTLHKQLPPTDVSETNYPNANDDAMGKTIPACFGDVPYVEMLNISGEPDEITLYTRDGIDYKAVASYQYFSSGSPDELSSVELLCTPGFDPDNIANPATGNDNYLMVCSGGGTPGPNTDICYKIFSASFAGRVSTPYGVADRIAVVFYGALPTGPDDYIANGYALTFASMYTTNTVWYFKVVSISTKNIVSERQIDGFETNGPRAKLIKYNTDSGKETDVSYLAARTSTGSDGKRPHLVVMSRNITKDGDITTIAGVTPESPKVMQHDETHPGYNWVAAPELIDRDRTTYFDSYQTVYSTRYHMLKFMIRVPTDVEWQDFDDVYLCFDFERTGLFAQGAFLQLRVAPRDCYGLEILDSSTITYFPLPDDFSLKTQYFNWIPNWYYDNGGNANSEKSRFKYWETVSGENIDNAEHLKLDTDMLTRMKSGDVGATLYIEAMFTLDTPDLTTRFRAKQIAFIGTQKFSTTDGNVYARVRGELCAAAQTNTVPAAFKHILEDYDGISSTNIDYGNLMTSRGNWHVGRQLTEKKSSFDFLRELCAQSFVCIVPKRNGDRKLTAWREDDGFTTTTHDETVIERNSLKKIEHSQISRVYNVFKLRYAWHPGRSDYVRSMTIDHVDEAVFPAFGVDVDGDGVDDWKTYVGGVSDGSYADAKILWEIAHASYLRSTAINELPKNYADLRWFTDYALFRPGVPSGFLGTGSSAFRALVNFVEWATRQFEFAEYGLSINPTNVVLELLTPIRFADSLLTSGVNRDGWITSLKLDPRRDKMTVESMLQPTDISTNGVDGDIVEVGDAADTIDESGSRTDTITEGA